MATQKVDTLLTDTCSVYKLYFFINKGIISSENIIIPNLGILEFHPVVFKEFEDDMEAYHLFKNLSPKPKRKCYPSFFDDLGEQVFPKIEKFIKANITKLTTSSSSDPDFLIQKKIYDDYRVSIQEEWRAQNRFQGSQKAVSEPSDEDYLIVYDALKNKVEVVTNDEILLEVSNHFLNQQLNKAAYMAEHVIKAVYDSNNSLRKDIEECAQNLGYLQEKFQLGLVLK